MKTFTLIIFCLLLSSIQIKAQSQDLVNNTWYLEKVIIDGVDYFVPDDNIVEYAEFFVNSMESQSSCNFFSSDLEYSLNDTNFTMLSFFLTLEDCLTDGVEIDEEIKEFEKSYLIDFFNYPSPDFNNPFAYEITDESPTLKKLTITNSNQDQAVYYSETLSTPDNEGVGLLKLYPNPAQNEFSVESDLALEQIKVYNELGQVVASFKAKESKLFYDITALPSGIYFIEVTSLEGKKTVTKLIKN